MTKRRFRPETPVSKHGPVLRSNSRPSPPGRRRFDENRLRRAGLVALAAALLASMGIRTVTLHLVSVSRSFTPLHAASVISLTSIGVLAAVFACTELNKLVAAPSDGLSSSRAGSTASLLWSRHRSLDRAHQSWHPSGDDDSAHAGASRGRADLRHRLALAWRRFVQPN